MGRRFIVGGDYNAKHQQWGSRLATPRGRELLKALQLNNLHHLSTEQPTYWPTDRQKIPDVIDFCVVKGIALNYLKAESSFELSSDHSPILVSLSAKIIDTPSAPTLTNQKTNWEVFRDVVEDRLAIDLPLKTGAEIDEALEHLIQTIQQAAWTGVQRHEQQI